MIRFFAPAILLLAAACGQGEPEAAIPTQGVVALSDQFTGEFELVNKNGAQVTDEDFEGKVMLVYFGLLCHVIVYL